MGRWKMISTRLPSVYGFLAFYCHIKFSICRMPITVYMKDKKSCSLKIIAEYGQEYGRDNPIRVLYHGYGHYDALRSPIGAAESKW